MKGITISTIKERIEKVHISIAEVDNSDIDKQEMCMLLKANADDILKILDARDINTSTVNTAFEIVTQIENAVKTLNI
jgi:hypothetical protein